MLGCHIVTVTVTVTVTVSNSVVVQVAHLEAMRERDCSGDEVAGVRHVQYSAAS